MHAFISMLIPEHLLSPADSSVKLSLLLSLLARSMAPQMDFLLQDEELLDMDQLLVKVYLGAVAD